MELNWKINMIDGSSHVVMCDESNAIDFVTNMLPTGTKETISIFKRTLPYTDTETLTKYDSIVILGSKVSSVEYFVGEVKNNE